jgi:UrcA family protein
MMFSILTRFAVSAVLSGTATFCALSLPFLPASAQAAAFEPATVRVVYADLNLETRAGRLALERRVRAAARRVCGSVNVRDLRATADANRCMEETLGVAKLRLASLVPAHNA